LLQSNTRSSQQLPTQSSLDQQTRYNLYSEIEKLTVLNLDLKKQNENLIRELDKQATLISRMPELEAKIHEMEKELNRKDANLAQSLRDIDFLRKDLVSLQKIEPAYNEMFAHNKRLLSEIDDLNNQLEIALHERDRLENEINALTGSHLKLNDALRRLDDLGAENEDKKRELYSLRDQNKATAEKIRLLQYENDRMQNVYNDAQKEILYLTNKQNEIERGHAQQILELEEKIESERRSHQQEKLELTGKFLSEKAQLENEINITHQRAEELHSKLSVMVAENEKLHKLNIEANKEIENLNLKLYQTEIKSEEDKDKIERDKRNQLTGQEKDWAQQLANQRLRYEERIDALKKDISELEKLKDIIKEREFEIENLKTQIHHNERHFEKKLSQTLDIEKDNILTKHSIEKGNLIDQLNDAKGRIADLEKQLNLMAVEVDRLANLHEEKEHEIHELQAHIQVTEKENKLELDDLQNRLLNEKKAELEDQEQRLTQIYESQLDALKGQNNDLEEKILKLAEANEQLHDLHEQKDNELDDHRYKLDVQAQKHSQVLQDLENRHENVLKYSLHRELSTVQSKNNAESLKYEARIGDLNKEITLLQNKIRHYEDEVSRLHGLIGDKHDEINDEKRRAAELEAQKAQEIAALNEHLEILRNANIDVLNSKTRFEAEKAALLSQIQQEKNKIDELERRVLLLLEENQNLKNLYNQKADDLSNLRKEMVEMHDEFDREKTALTNEIEELKNARLNIEELTIKHTGETVQLENQIRQLKTLNDNNKEELQSLYNLLDQRKKELDHQDKTNDDLRKQIEDQSENLRKIESHSQTVQDKYDGLQKKTEQLRQERDLYATKIEKLNIELSQNNNDLRKKIEELDVVKKKYEKGLELATQLNAQLMAKLTRNE
jgi:chromosome segregation ATPase